MSFILVNINQNLYKFFVTLLALSVFTIACNRKEGNETASEKDINNETAAISGEALAKIHCASCHAFPAPELLDKATWQYGVLPQMGYRMGIYEDTTRQSLIENGPGGALVEKSGIFPQKPIVSEEQWEQINAYYAQAAPESLPMPEKEVQTEIQHLKVEIPEFRIDPPLITFIKYNTDLNQMYVADVKADYSTINILNNQLESISTLALPSPISHISFRSDTILATLMGGFMPTDNPSGSIVKIFKKPGEKEYKGFTTLLKNLQRPAAVAYQDFNEDDLEDIVVCEYGNHTGKLSLFLNQKSGQYARKILSVDPGAICVVIRDLNHDELPDIVALMAQGNERIDVYYNQGGGTFQVENLVQFPASYGSASISMLDWNQDGFEDIIYVNGDNADYSQILKPYHGVRIFLNDGENHFKEAYFQHINGASKAITHDFDQDGDLDIATISFFPDLINSPEEGFIFLENISSEEGIQFNLHSFNQAASGRWITMEAADFDKDGKSEIILGAFTGMAIQGDMDGKLGTQLIENSPTVMVLKF